MSIYNYGILLHEDMDEYCDDKEVYLDRYYVWITSARRKRRHYHQHIPEYTFEWFYCECHQSYLGSLS